MNGWETGFILSEQKTESVVEKQGMLCQMHLTLDARSVIHTLNTHTSKDEFISAHSTFYFEKFCSKWLLVGDHDLLAPVYICCAS
jgi:hypothetical protein